MSDPFAHLKEGASREVQTIDEHLEHGEIDEEQWHLALQALVEPAYLAADTPWGQSGKSGTAEDWEWSRSLAVDASAPALITYPRDAVPSTPTICSTSAIAS